MNRFLFDFNDEKPPCRNNLFEIKKVPYLPWAAQNWSVVIASIGQASCLKYILDS